MPQRPVFETWNSFFSVFTEKRGDSPIFVDVNTKPFECQYIIYKVSKHFECSRRGTVAFCLYPAIIVLELVYLWCI